MIENMHLNLLHKIYLTMYCKSIFILLFCLIIPSIQLKEITFTQYERQEQTNHQILFTSILKDPLEKHHPNIKKLIFTTPWNDKGNQYTLKYGNKIDYVSPCWYTIRIGNNGNVQFENQNNYQSAYTKMIRQQHPHIKLLPRIYIQGSSANVFQTVGTDKKQMDKLLDLVSSAVSGHGFDGIVWDSPYNYFEPRRHGLNNLIVEIISHLKQLMKDKLIFFNMGNPQVAELQVEPIQKLKVDAILIQNYDSSDKYLDMVQMSIQWSKKLNKTDCEMIMMLPFFTVKLNTGSISTIDAKTSLEKNGISRSMFMNGVCNFFEKNTKKRYFVPCYSYFKQAYQMIEDEGYGVGYWQGGNGLQLYYQLM